MWCSGRLLRWSAHGFRPDWYLWCHHDVSTGLEDSFVGGWGTFQNNSHPSDVVRGMYHTHNDVMIVEARSSDYRPNKSSVDTNLTFIYF
jgi:hypothetical protein